VLPTFRTVEVFIIPIEPQATSVLADTNGDKLDAGGHARMKLDV
jgi:hypothetical protein